ncbi:chorismate-binding protein [uncultured Psychroserpens sp.]|uniref:chorismate-binding protein n=1 Tax=uncultured Psychroserpens sp. TaxID=255436 RepID=UPI0026144687|nr:chorismate-binding protein [uncultured Psychroserpens sp.]
MESSKFFSHIDSHFKSQLPFVVYRKPNSASLSAIFQEDSTLHVVGDFNESGFVFSPFDSQDTTVIFPSELSKLMTLDIIIDSKTEHHNSKDYLDEIHDNQHIELVQKGIDTILTDALQKIVLSRVKVIPVSEESPIELFQKLLKMYREAFVYLWYHPKVGLWLGATPETLLSTEGRRFNTMSLAGTQSYKDTVDVAWNKKNKEEQQLVTDYIVKELEPHVEQLYVSDPKTIKAGRLLHLKSQISGVLKPSNLKEVIFSLHPTPAVCGLPKAKAKDFILRNEHYNREFYTGFLGELNIKKSKTRNINKRNVENNAYTTIKTTSQLFVNLRCMQIKNQQALVYVGGGITKDSNAQEEWEETVKKTQTMASVLD